MGKAHLTADQRASLRDFTAGLMCHRPDVLTRGTQIADQARHAFPALDDETIAAVLDVAVSMAGTYHQATGCGHLAAYSRLLSAAVADLAHLELDPPGRP